MKLSPLLDEFLHALQCLPGVGAKTAQRMAFHLLERDRLGAERLAQCLQQAISDVGHCQRCNTLTELALCPICANTKRAQAGQLCVVASPADVWAIEQTQLFDGQYFVLMGQLSPLDGIGPHEIGLDKLEQRLQQGDVNEVIIAINPSVEGEATAYYIAEFAKAAQVAVSRIAHGIPLGGELEQVDGHTLRHSLLGRQPFHYE